jgi:hypothetical protein
VSSEADYDTGQPLDALIFYVDDFVKEKGKWGGVGAGWKQVSVIMNTSGNHKLRWVYQKDSLLFDGQDTVWIDDIIFSNASTELSYTVSVPNSSSTGSISCETPVKTGGQSVCVISSANGYHLDPSSFTDNGIVVPVINNSYTITNVQGDHAITGKFVLDAPSDVETFETVDFSKFPWIRWGTDVNGIKKVGATTWDVVTGGYSGVYGGTIAAASPPKSLNEGERDGEASYLETELFIPKPGVMSFWYKVSSELDIGGGGDYLRFFIDNIEQTHIDPDTQLPTKGWSGEIAWDRVSYGIDTGSHIFRWVYVKDGSGSSGEDRAWIDDIVFPGAVYKSTYSITVQNPSINGLISCPETASHGSESICTIAPNPGYHLSSLIDNGADKLLSVSVDSQYIISNITSDHVLSGTFVLNGNIEDFEAGFTKFPWSTSGSTTSLAWIITDQSGHTGTYNGTHAAETPNLANDQTSYLETTQVVPPGGVISFWYKVSSEPDSDFLKFYIDGVNVEGASWSGELDWAWVSYPVTEGTRTFRWEYSKNNADIVPSLFDKAWIDDIAFTGTAADFPVKIERGVSSVIYKTTLQEAYNDAMSTDIIKLKPAPNMGGLLAGNNVSVTVKGGYNDTFTSNAAMTTVGPIYINAGTVRLERITVK